MIELAHGYVARLVRQRAEAAFEAVNTRHDLQRCARLHALAAYLESHPDAAKVFAALAPTTTPREFPSAEFWAQVESFAEHPGCDLHTLTERLVSIEATAALDTELPALT